MATLHGAWEAIQTQHFDLMITNNSMPKVTGIELVNKLQAAGNKLEIIFLTGEFPYDQFKRYPWLKNMIILTKPLTNSEILSVVGKTLNNEANQIKVNWGGARQRRASNQRYPWLVVS